MTGLAQLLQATKGVRMGSLSLASWQHLKRPQKLPFSLKHTCIVEVLLWQSNIRLELIFVYA